MGTDLKNLTSKKLTQKFFRLEEFDIEEVDTEILEEKLKDPLTLKAIYMFIQEDEENYDF